MELLRERALADEIFKTTEARFVMKCFFRITHLMVTHKWAHFANFTDLVKLVAAYGAKEVDAHLLFAPRNAVYMSNRYIEKYVDIMVDYIKKPLLESLCNGQHFTFYTDETTDITR